jgi:multisubunit Na+/H+ antiporter MnhB subunit
MTNTETLNPRPPRHIVQSIGAVFAGLVAVFVLSLGTDVVLHATGIYPPWLKPMSTGLWILATAYRIVYGIAGGYITARLAPNRPLLHALVLGVVGLALSIAGAAGTWNRGPEFGSKWYPLAVIAMALPCSWLGGRLVSNSRRDS